MNFFGKIGLIVLGCYMAAEAFSICPEDSIFKDVHIEVEPHKSVTSDVTAEVEGCTSVTVAQPPKRGDAEVIGSELIYTSTSDECRRDTIICHVTVGTDSKYVRYVVHVRAKTGGEGTDFWLAFMNNYDEHGYGAARIDITAAQEAHVNVSMPTNSYSVDYVIPAYSKVTTPPIGACMGSDVIENRGVHITSDVPISVVAGNYGSETTDATAVLPTSALGTEYTIMHQDELNRAEICIVGTQTGTQVTVVPTVKTEGGQPAGVPFTFNISPGSAYQLQADDHYKTFAGTTIKANKPIAVFEGCVCTYYPQEYGACDHNYEQCLPYKFWGKRYVYARLSTKRDYYKLYSRTNNNVITKNGEYLTTLQAGQSYTDYFFEDVGYFEGTEPFAFSQYMAACGINGTGDPAIINVRPLEAGIEYALFNIPRGVAIQNDSLTKVNIIASKDVYSGITVDNKAVYFEPIVGYDSIYYATINGLNFGLHNIKSTKGTFIATCSAVTEYESYCFQIAPSVEGVRDTLVKINASICSNQTYDFNGRCLDSSGVYYDTLYSVNWRDSIVELTLTVQPSYEIVTDTTMTYWSSLDWREHHLTNIIHDTLIIDSLQTIGTGCDSVYVLNLTAQCAKVDTIVKDTAICSNDWPYKWHSYRDTLIYEPGTHMDSIRGYKCDSIYYYLHIKNLPTDTTDTTVYFCPKNLPTTWNGETIDVIGDYEFHYVNQHGCDSVVYLHALSSVTRGEEKVVLCKDDLPYSWYGHSINAEGDYQATLTNVANCDSIVTLHFYITNFCSPTKPINPTVDCIDTTYSTIDTTFCDWELQTKGFLWFENMYYEAGTYHDTLVGQNYLFCDSVGTLILRTEECPCDTAYSFTEQTIKEKDDLPFTWNEMVVSAVPQNAQHDTTLVFQTLKADESCDSIATLHLIVEPYLGSLTIIQTYEHFNYDTLQAHPYTWQFTGKEYTEPGFYADTIIEVKDTTIGQLLLTVDYTRTISICAGQTADSIETPWGKFGFDTCTCLTGCLMQTLDSICIVDAQLCIDTLPVAYDTVDVTLPYDTLKEKGYQWFGEMRDTAGVYRDTLYGQASNGCDSIGLLILRVTYQDSMFVCGEDTAIFTTPWGDYGVPRTCECMEGWIRKTADNEGLVWAKLCVTRLYTNTVREDTTLCYGTSIVWHGITIDQTKEYEYHEPFTRLTTCDSVVFYLNATVKDEPEEKPTVDAVCAGEAYTWNTYRVHTITGSGTYYDTLKTVDQKCDSIHYTLTLTHKAHSTGQNDTTVCNLPVVWEDSTWTEAGIKIKTLKNALGCDSVVTLTLYVNEPTDQKDQDTIVCYGETIFWRNRLWKDLTKDSTLKDTLKYKGSPCDSIRYERTIHVRAQAKDSVSNEYACYGADVEWRGQKVMNITATQTLTDKVAYKGTTCDSIRFEHTVHVLPKYTDNKNEQICTGGQYIWKRDGKKDSIITIQGEYYDTVRYVSTGCDSMTYYLKLTVGNINIRTHNASSCENSIYSGWRKEIQVTTKDSVYKDTAKAATPEECDTVYLLNMTVLHKTSGDTTAYACEGSTFYWRGQIAHDGDKITLINAAGCDSIVTLKLTELTSINKQDEDTTICYGESVYWRGRIWNTLTKDSSLTDTIKHKLNILCDSICFKRIVHVREKAKDDVTNETVCYGSDVTWRGQTITNITAEQMLYDKEYYKGTTCDSVLFTHTIHVKDCGCPEPTIKPTDVVNICDTLMPYTWKASKEIKIFEAGHYSDTLRTKSGCDSIIYFLDLSTYTCCKPLTGTIEVRDICADEPVMDVIVKLTYGHFTSYRVHYTNAPGNTMPFRDTLVTSVPQEQDGHVLLTLPVPHDAADRKRYPRPDEYAIQLTLYNECGDSLLLSALFNVLYPSWLLDQHWDDVIAILNDRYNGGYTFSKIEWLRNGEKLPGEDELYVFLPHQLWNNEQDEHRDYQYQALLTRADDGKTMLSCPMTPLHIDSTNVLTEPYVAVTPTLVPQDNPVVHVQTNTEGTYWLYSATGKLLQTADYEPCEHNVFDIYLTYNVQTMYILVFTPRNETKPLQKKYRVVKLLVE